MYSVEVPCSDCERGAHEKCDGEAWNNDFECVVDCACLVCAARYATLHPEADSSGALDAPSSA